MRLSKESPAPVDVTTPSTDQATAEPPPGSSYEISSWDLSELLPDVSPEAIDREIEHLEELVARFESTRDRLDPEMDPADFLAIVRQYEEMIEGLSRLSGYSHLWFASDTQSTPALTLRNRVQQFITRFGNRVLFLHLWWKSLDDDEAERLLPPGDDNADLRHHLREERLFKPYALDEQTEQIINIKNANGIEAVKTLYSMLTNRLEFEIEIDGETRTMTEDQMRNLFFSPRSDLRVATCQEIYRVYEREAPVLAQLYINRVRDWYTEYVELRGFASPISVRNLSNDVPDAAVETLLDVVSRNAPLFQEYFKLKGKWLGIEPHRRYDIYAPLATSDRHIPFAEAARNVLDTFRRFDDRFGELAERVLARRHVDSEVRKGKRGGAFCSSPTPRLTPWVLVNYAGGTRDVATLAHELGHAIHSMLASEHSILTLHASLPLAETASVFAEMLMTDRLLAQEREPRVRRELLASQIDDIYATVMRQTFFVRFELAAHQAILDNRSADDLFDLYDANLREQFGDEMDIAPEFRMEWLTIPHMFRTPFYCYAYSFGQLLVLALYRRYQQEGDAFKPGYLRLLSHGGAARPAEILGELDIDMTDAAFWQSGFDVIRGILDELKSLDI